jgi:hypothetical protein
MVGTVVVVFLYFLLARYAGYSLLIQGVILIFIMLLSPQGLVGLARRIAAHPRLGRIFPVGPGRPHDPEKPKPARNDDDQRTEIA